MSSGRNIEVFVCAGDQSADYMAILKSSLTKLASNENRLSFKCIINTTQFDRVDGWEAVEIDPTVETCEYPKAIGSHNHGRQMNKIHKYASGDLLLICDVDTIVLQRDWDKILSSKIGGKCAIAGVNSSKQDGRYIGFPCAIFCMYDTRVFKDIQPDFLPAFRGPAKKAGFREQRIGDAQASLLWNMPIGSHFRCDTGWQLPKIYRSRRHKAFLLEHEDNLNKRPMHPQFEAWYYGKQPFVMHAGGSRSLRHNKFEEWKRTVSSIGY